MPTISYYRDKTRRIFIEGDTTSMRALFAGGSFWWAIVLWSPTQPFSRPAYSWLSAIAGETVWGCAFMLHCLLALWRVYDPRSSSMLGLAVGAYGLVLWIYATAGINLAVGEITPTSGLAWLVIAANVVSLYRNGFNNDEVSKP